jgi:hypothetical protein
VFVGGAAPAIGRQHEAARGCAQGIADDPVSVRSIDLDLAAIIYIR